MSGQAAQKGLNTRREETVITGSELVERVKTLVKKGNVSRLIIKKPNGDVLLEVPLTAGAVVGGTFVLMTPVLAAIGALAALLAKVRVEIVRSEKVGDDKRRL